MPFPAEFIELAEETGLIVPLGGKVIEKVCAQLSFWAIQGEAPVPASINISAWQFQEVDQIAMLDKPMLHYDVPLGPIQIEITEWTIAEKINALRKRGIRLLVDDFGTGYSSLSQLLDVNALKVDQSFTRELGRSEDGKVFFAAIVIMAHALGMRVVAEGVETAAQFDALADLDCDEVQGYFVSEPLSSQDIQERRGTAGPTSTRSRL